jgi:outer membrane protein OmpA-like peptidoglycan-associated protein
MHLRGKATRPLCSVPLACLLTVAVAGCAGSAPHPALDDAHAAVESARRAPRVRALAAAELDLAEIALEQASFAARAGAPPAEVEHLAYVASQRAAFAEARAAAEVARSETRLLRRAMGQAAVEPRLGDQETPPLARKDRVRPAPQKEDQRQHVSAAADPRTRAAAPDAMAADVETMPQDVLLRLAQLPFEQAEPSAEALEELAGLAERLLREPGRSLVIEAEFGMPAPEARTLVERRVEVVRAFFLERGVAPARLVVHATGNAPVRPPTPSVVEPTE